MPTKKNGLNTNGSGMNGLSVEQMKQLKQVNVSKDSEKTKERVREDFTSATNALKNVIVDLSGQKRSSFYRVFRTGMANARLILAMSQTLNVSPYYYVGTQDIKAPCSDEIILQFLEERFYIDLVEEIKGEPVKLPGRIYWNTNTATENDAEDDLEDDADIEDDANDDSDDECCCGHSDVDEDEFEDVISFEMEFPDDENMKNAVANLTEDDAILLLRALLKRAEAGGDAFMTSEVVKRCLLS